MLSIARTWANVSEREVNKAGMDVMLIQFTGSSKLKKTLFGNLTFIH